MRSLPIPDTLHDSISPLKCFPASLRVFFISSNKGTVNWISTGCRLCLLFIVQISKLVSSTYNLSVILAHHSEKVTLYNALSNTEKLLTSRNILHTKLFSLKRWTELSDSYQSLANLKINLSSFLSSFYIVYHYHYWFIPLFGEYSPDPHPTQLLFFSNI